MFVFLVACSASATFAQCHVIAVNRPDEFKPGQSLSLSISQLPEISIPEYQPVESIREALLQRIQAELRSANFYSSVIILRPGEKPQTDLLFKAEITIVELAVPFVILTTSGTLTVVQLHIALISARSNRNILELECLGSAAPGYIYKPKKLLAKSIDDVAKNLKETFSKLPKEIQNQSGSALKPILATTEIAESERHNHLTDLKRWSPWNYSRLSVTNLSGETPPTRSIEIAAEGLNVSSASAKSADAMVVADIVTSRTAPFLRFNHRRLLNLRYMLYSDHSLTGRHGGRHSYIWGRLYESDKMLSPPLNTEYISPGQLRVEIDSTDTIAVWIRYDKRALTYWNTDRIREATTLTSSAHPNFVVKPLRVYNLTGQVSEHPVLKITRETLIYPKFIGEIHLNNSVLMIFPNKNQDGSSIIESLKGNVEIHTELDGHQVTIKIDLSKLQLQSVDQIYNRKPD